MNIILKKVSYENLLKLYVSFPGLRDLILIELYNRGYRSLSIKLKGD